MREEASAVVIGASAGAVEALSAILPALPREYKLPVVVVVHLPSGKQSFMSELFSPKCAVQIREPDDKEPLQRSTVYFAPSDYHLLLEKNGCISLSNEEPVNYSRPSIDVLFESAADAFGAGTIGVVLTGANDDGARGSKAILDAGGEILVQRPDLAHAPSMPRATLELCSGARMLSLEEIATYLAEKGRAA